MRLQVDRHLLTIRPLKEDGTWGAKCRKVYDLDSQGQRIPDGKGGWKSHREDTTDWNQRSNAEKWRAAWASYANRALEAAGRPERIDHRSYKRQGVDKIPSVHMGPAVSQMERRGIQTEKGNINREIAADNKLLKEIKARITRLYNWSKEQSAQPPAQESITDFLFQARQNATTTSRYGKVKALKADAKLFNFLMENGIKSMQELFDKVIAINSDYYDLRGKIVSKERRISALTERLEMWAQYQKYKPMANKLPNATAGMTFPRPKPDTPPSMVKKIGKTTYLVWAHFSETSTETMEDKIKRMLREEVRQMMADE